MKRLILVAVITFFCCQVYGQFVYGDQDISRNKERSLKISGTITDALIPFNPEQDFPCKILVYSEYTKEVLSFYTIQNGAFEVNLDPGMYKVIFSKMGYKSKMISVEVKHKKSILTSSYEIPVEINLDQGIDERELEFAGKIIYNSETDYYESEKY
ncbi:MAG: carboxypeptidase regulatory-like domain-containing protein [Flavobacteriales bacterium]|nr:carboxypeptidase regulatory-like domain-containing protein [Flavobacteriales bacterium]